MSFVDNDPPKHLDVESIRSGKGISIYDRSDKKYKYVLLLTLEEKKALISHGEPLFSSIFTNSKKKYERALEIKKRAQKYLEEDKSKSDENLETTL